MSTVLNIAAYRFVSLEESDLKHYSSEFKARTSALDLKGTVLLSLEGINFSLAGSQKAIHSFQHYLDSQLPFSNLSYRTSCSKAPPFEKMMIKLKKQIIPFPILNTPIKNGTVPYVAPKILKDWIQNKSDLFILDVRNEYEVAEGSFQNAIQLYLKQFRDFPKASQSLPKEIKQKTVVTFCTGGIRCEKAGMALIEQGFKKVYQLEGGILNYFSQCHDAHYKGGCFVFDEREVVYAADTQEA